MGARLDELRKVRAANARAQELEDLRALMAQPAFLRFLERLAFYGKVAESPKRATEADTFHVIGWQDLAKTTLQRCAAADNGAMAKMVTDHFTRAMLEAIDDEKAIADDGD